ncbi:uncharacterized protein LOC130765620 isoform X1 [Actinidia eriantha]|uniref:uncharacterized protein LOC130765620 isoform X1 n=1 Tax=Actinidia eriantha TaxID=165200 RepID=UPI00258FC407|nr:uncharacterized protein LOC130765620 isoform X1 [Actinidia eriantha]XP_057478064.1 uncharacterized protein LOC130765620 isoform X1 [Actinidia eriantha]
MLLNHETHFEHFHEFHQIVGNTNAFFSFFISFFTYLFGCVFNFFVKNFMICGIRIYCYQPDLQQSRGCLGCGAKAQLITAVDEPFHWHGMWSQRDVSSTSESNPPPPLDPPNSAGGTSNPSEFVNHGKLKSSSLESNEAAVDCSRDATYESLIGTNKPFPQPIPLPEMVDFLVDVWEQEGLYI